MVTEDDEDEADNTGSGGEVVINSLPTELAGMAEPTPVLVKGVGSSKVEVFGSAIVSPS